jgi:hypothetical protein
VFDFREKAVDHGFQATASNQSMHPETEIIRFLTLF